MTVTDPNISIKDLKENALQEHAAGIRKRPYCDMVCLKAMEEIKQRKSHRPFSRLFYELAFFYREEHCLTAAFNVWQPVIRRWIARFDFKMGTGIYDDIVDDIFYDAFDTLFKASLRNKLDNFEAGVIHNFLRETVRRKVFARCQTEKRELVTKMKKRLKKLQREDISFMREILLPEYIKKRDNFESRLFELYVLKKQPVKEILKDDVIELFVQPFSNPSKALHNRIPTILWNAYKILKRIDGMNDCRRCRDIIDNWTGGSRPPTLSGR